MEIKMKMAKCLIIEEKLKYSRGEWIIKSFPQESLWLKFKKFETKFSHTKQLYPPTMDKS